MSDTPETDQASRLPTVGDATRYVVIRGFAENLERQRDAYAETIAEILAMDPDWTVIRRRHPELTNQ